MHIMHRVRNRVYKHLLRGSELRRFPCWREPADALTSGCACTNGCNAPNHKTQKNQLFNFHGIRRSSLPQTGPSTGSPDQSKP